MSIGLSIGLSKHMTEARGIAATAWCTPANSGKVMDADLAEAFAERLALVMSDLELEQQNRRRAELDAFGAHEALAQTRESMHAAYCRAQQAFLDAHYELDKAKAAARSNTLANWSVLAAVAVPWLALLAGVVGYIVR